MTRSMTLLRLKFFFELLILSRISFTIALKCPYANANLNFPRLRSMDKLDNDAHAQDDALNFHQCSSGDYETAASNYISKHESVPADMESSLQYDNPQHSSSIAATLSHPNIPAVLIESSHQSNHYEQVQLNQRPPPGSPCGTWPLDCSTVEANQFFRSIDGTCNNWNYPQYGMAKWSYERLIPTNYQLKTAQSGTELPNSRDISLGVFGTETHPEEALGMMFMQFGQFVAHDIAKLAPHSDRDVCCPKNGSARITYPCLPIHMQSNDLIHLDTGNTCLEFKRAVTARDASCCMGNSPKLDEKLSIVTGYLDLSSLYGNSAEESLTLRALVDGKLISSFRNGQQFLPISEKNSEACLGRSYCFAVPDNRNRFTPTITVVHTVFLREHNRIAEQLRQIHPSYNDERLFQEARKINIAQYQKIVYYEYLPIVLGWDRMRAKGLIYDAAPGARISDYDASINAAPLAEFAAAAFRYSHIQIPGWFLLIPSPDAAVNESLRLSNYFNQLDASVDLLTSGNNLEATLRGLLMERQKRSDLNISPEIKYYFGRTNLSQMGSDLKAIDIQRARDFSLPTYNEMRQYCGLSWANDWSGFRPEISPEIISVLSKIYAHPNDVDLAVGGSLEFHADHSLFGPTFLCILEEQFRRTRKGDRFFFENADPNTGFTGAQLDEIRKTSLASILCNAEPHLQAIQPNAFVIPNTQNPLVACDQIQKMDLRKWAY